MRARRAWFGLTSRDVGERAKASRVQEGVQEAEGAVAGGDQLVVEQRDYACEDRAGAARAVDGRGGALVVDLDGVARGGDIGETAAGGVVLAAVGAAERGEVGRVRGGLIGGDAPVVGEPAG